jgi:hypothetical protein
MTTYTTITDGQVDQDSPISQALVTALRNNPLAIAEGATGAPRIVAGALSTATNSVSVTVGSSGSPTYEDITMDAYSFFPGTGGDANTDVYLMPATGTANADAPKIRVGGTPLGNSDTVDVAWRYIIA